MVLLSTLALLGTGVVATWTALWTLRCWSPGACATDDELPLSFSSKPLDDFDIIEIRA